MTDNELLNLIRRICGYTDTETPKETPKVSVHEYNGNEGKGLVFESEAMKVIIIEK